MPKINVYLPDELADAVRDAQIPVSAICQAALERAVRDVTAMRASDVAPPEEPGRGPFRRFTPRTRQAMALAERAARAQPNDHVDTEHLLLGMLDEGGNLGWKILASLEIEIGDLRAELQASMGRKARLPKGELPFGPLAKKVLELTAIEANQMGHGWIGCEHLLLGLIAVEDGLASQVLRRMGLELRITRRAVITALSGFVHAQQNPAPGASNRPQDSKAAFEEILRRLGAIERQLA